MYKIIIHICKNILIFYQNLKYLQKFVYNYNIINTQISAIITNKHFYTV